MKLTVATFLRSFMPEHGPGIPHPVSRPLLSQQLVFNHGTYAAGRAFRTQAQAVPTAIREGVHLFFDDIGHFTDGVLKQRSALDQGQTDLLVTTGRQEPSDHRFQVTPAWRRLRQNIVHAAHGGQSSQQSLPWVGFGRAHSGSEQGDGKYQRGRSSLKRATVELPMIGAMGTGRPSIATSTPGA